MDWNGIRYFLALAEMQTLGDAAVMLGTSDATVMRRIQQLESETKTVLFNRSRRGHQLTAQGARMLPIAAELRTLANRFEHDYAENEKNLTGRVTIATTEYGANYLIAPKLNDFYSKHPNIQLTLDISPKHVDLSATEPTVALRFERPERSSYVVNKIGEVAWGLYIERRLAAKLKLSAGTVVRGNEPIIGWSTPVDNIQVAQWLLREFPKSICTIEMPNLSGHLSSAQMGLGLFSLLNTSILAESKPLRNSSKPPLKKPILSWAFESTSQKSIAAAINWAVVVVAD